MRRWLPLVVGSLAVMTVAVGTALGVDGLLQPASGPPPQLKTVSASALAEMGVTLAPAQPLAYCKLLSAAAERGVHISSHSGCPVARSAAEASARGAAPGLVQEAVLARVSAVKTPLIGTDRLVWVVVIQPPPNLPQTNPLYGCPPAVLVPGGGLRPCQTFIRPLTSLAFVDARTGQFLTSLEVAAPPGPALQATPVSQDVTLRNALAAGTVQPPWSQ